MGVFGVSGYCFAIGMYLPYKPDTIEGERQVIAVKAT
jgi:hypothetical protein